MSLSPAKRALLEKWRRGAAGAGPGLGAIPRRPDGGHAPLSFAQQRIWFVDRLDAGRTALNIGATFRVSGALDRGRLHASLNEIVQRHEALRTSFVEADGTPVQVVAPVLTVPLPVVDVAGLADDERRSRILQLKARELEHRFDLATGPLLRVLLIGCSDREHLLLLVRHQIVADDWSHGLFVDELVAHYAAKDPGGRGLAPLAVQYADYSAWQRGLHEEQAGHLAYWKQQLGGVIPVLDLPVDRPRAGRLTFQGALVSFDVPSRLASSVSALARAEQATSFMILLAAFQALLGRYSDVTDITVGCPIANRTRRPLENLIGLFANTVVMRADLSGNPTFREFLAQVRDTCLAAYAHQDVPFEQIVEALHPGRDGSPSPLFRAMFVLQNAPAGSRHLPGLSIELAGIDTAASMFDISLILRETDSGFHGALEYSTDLFDAERIARFARHYVQLLESVAADPDQPVDRLTLLDATQRREVMSVARGVGQVEGAGQCLHELFEVQAALHPSRTAVKCDGRQLTYAALDRAATRLAYELQRMAVGPEVRVGICVERSVELVVAMLAALKAGGAYVPLDPGSPGERLRWLLADTGAAVVLTTPALRDRMAATGVPIVEITSDMLDGSAGDGCEVLRTVRPDNLAYIIHTSGSSGRPKGVLVTHANVVSSTRARSLFYRDSIKAFLLLSPITFDSSVAGVFWTLCSGGTLVIPSEEEFGQTARLARLIASESISHLLAIPTWYRVLLDEIAPSCFASLRTVVVAGEACPPALVEQHHDTIPAASLVNEYGPTETTVWSTAQRCDDRPGTGVPIGRPIPGTQSYVLDRHLELVPHGVAGELCIGGDGVTRGYLSHPGMTAERFVPDPFSGAPGGRLYRTGDRVRRRLDGNLEFLGRTDRQVKIRGVRIEAGEIEHALAAHPAVRGVAVTTSEGDAGRIAAHVVVSGAPVMGACELESFARTVLPHALVPSVFLVVDVLPRLPNGKVDYGALALAASDPEPERTGLLPATPTEIRLAHIWAALLPIERIDADTSFFELGGHSLLAARVLARVRDAFGVELPLRVVFDAPSVALLAARIDAAREHQNTAIGPVPALARSPSGRDEVPLSYAQERLWFLDRLNTGSAAYNVPTAARLSGPLDRAALSRAVRTIVARHESLRTSFEVREGRPVQCITRSVDVPICERDLRGLPDDVKQATLAGVIADQAAEPFDLTRAPLLRIVLLQLDEEEHVLQVTTHHIVSDGWSLNVFFSELAAAYGTPAGEAPHLPPLTVQYADYAVWQRAFVEADGLRSQLDYWKHQLADLTPTLDLPADRPRPPIPSMRGTRHLFLVPSGLSSDLSWLSRRERVTPFMLLLAAFGALICRYTEQEDIAIGTPVAGRRRAELDNVIGFFVNMLVLRVSCAGRPTFRELLHRTRKTCLDADANQDLPFEQLVGSLQTERDISRQALFQVAFAVQNAPDDVRSAGNLRLTRLDNPACTSKFDLTLMLTERDGGWQGTIEYSTDLFDAGRIARLARHYVRLLESVAADPDQTVDRAALLEAAERSELLAASAESRAVEPPLECLHELFEARAAQRPNAVAASCDGDLLTYSALDVAATRLARRLQRLGVGPEVPVAICLERSLELVVAILAVLKAGGAYVPLDPGWPAERLRWLVTDTGAPVVLTEPSLRDRVDTGAVRVIDVTAQAGEDCDGEDLVRAVRPENLAYIIYTSGSTGLPKGVPVTHANVVQLFAAVGHTCQFTSSDVWTFFHSAAFDFSVWELWGAWLYGARLVIVPRDVQRSPEAFYRLLEIERVTVLNQTPSSFRHLARIAISARESAALALRLVIFGGEALDVSRLGPWFDRFGDAVPRLVNMYGITETTVHVTYRELKRSDVETRWVSPVGRRLPHLDTYILDRQGQPVPVGIPGELYVGGAGLARGYHGRADLTAERFVPDPFGRAAGARLYRTGDRARLSSTGEIEYLGRLDNQVKVRGFRVETGEIEAVLESHPAVREAAVVGRLDQPGDTRLVAYVAFTAGERPRVDALRGWVADRIPEPMVPAEFIALDALPRTSGGKVDRRSLPAPRGQRPDLEREYVAPHGPAEEAIAAMWADVLQVKGVGVLDNFFSLGGNSLLIAQLHERLQAIAAPGVPMVSLFKYPTVRAFAEHLQSPEAGPSAADRGRARAGARQHAIGQQRLAARARQGMRDGDDHA